MRNPIKINLPGWSFSVARKISELRSSHFQNRFKNEKIRRYHNREPYYDHIESIIGYLGDIACAIFLGIDPKETLKDMVYSTGCLTHRDEHDLFLNGCSIDVKIEDYNGYQKKVLNNTIKTTEPYGCRLINENQWTENGQNIDIYVFGAFDAEFSGNFKLHGVKNVNLIGFIKKDDAEALPFSNITPAGRKLPTRAKIIPNTTLIDIDQLKDIQGCGRTFNLHNSKVNDPDCLKIIKELEKIWQLI